MSQGVERSRPGINHAWTGSYLVDFLGILPPTVIPSLPADAYTLTHTHTDIIVQAAAATAPE